MELTNEEIIMKLILEKNIELAIRYTLAVKINIVNILLIICKKISIL